MNENDKKNARDRLIKTACLMSAEGRDYSPAEIAAVCGLPARAFNDLLSYPQREYIRQCFEKSKKEKARRV